MHRRYLSLVLLVIVAVAAVPVFASHGWSNYHWSKPGSYVAPPVVMNISSAWTPYMDRVMIDWNKSAVIESPWNTGAISSRKRCTSATGQIEVCNATYGQNGWLGLAGISVSGGHIVKGYTKLNDTYYNTATYNTPAWRRLVFCQEVGHDYGLGHQDETQNNANLGSCMDYTNDPDGGAGGASSTDPTNEYPNAHDYDQLLIQYNHSDLVQQLPFDAMVADATRPTTIEEFMNKADQWGEPIAFDPQGRPTTFFLKTGPNHGDEGHGLTGEITDVFWAPVDPFEDNGNGGTDRDGRNQ